MRPPRDTDNLGKEKMVSSFSSEIIGTYLLSFHACDPATTDCTDPRNHRVYVAQSNDGFNWNIVPGWEPTQGSVPDLIRRGDTLYVFYCYWGQLGSRVLRYDFGTDTWATPVSLDLIDDEAPDGIVDMSATIDNQGRLVLFYLVATAGQDPAGCAHGETTCTKHFRSATEVEGSDGTQFSADSGDRLRVTIENTSSASDPDIFFDGSRYVLYISRRQSVQVYTSRTLQGEYTLYNALSDGYLTNSVGIACGYFDKTTSNYYTYGHTYDGIIRRAVHASLDKFLDESDFATTVTGNSMGLGESCQVQSPGFALNTKGATYPIPDIKANSEDGPITVSLETPVSISVSLNSDILAGQNADWWVAKSNPSGTFNCYNLSAGAMVPGLSPTYQGPLFNLGTTNLINYSELNAGTHTFYFGVDLKMNGSLDMDFIYYDSVSVNVVEP